MNEVAVGSYVKYAGNNGCDTTSVNGWNSCSGKNANYVDDGNKGYCNGSGQNFSVNGWRVGYIKDGSAHLVAAGATDCMCTDSSDNPHSDSCSGYLSADDLYKHFDNMDSLALKYCNTEYSKGGICNNTTAWAMDAIDFEKITNKPLNVSSCLMEVEDESCGYNNSLIDNGGIYWYGTRYSSSESVSFNWRPDDRYVYGNYAYNLYGVRPVLSLDSSVIIVGGTGTYEDPYIVNK